MSPQPPPPASACANFHPGLSSPAARTSSSAPAPRRGSHRNGSGSDLGKCRAPGPGRLPRRPRRREFHPQKARGGPRGPRLPPPSDTLRRQGLAALEESHPHRRTAARRGSGPPNGPGGRWRRFWGRWGPATGPLAPGASPRASRGRGGTQHITDQASAGQLFGPGTLDRPATKPERDQGGKGRGQPALSAAGTPPANPRTGSRTERAPSGDAPPITYQVPIACGVSSPSPAQQRPERPADAIFSAHGRRQ